MRTVFTFKGLKDLTSLKDLERAVPAGLGLAAGLALVLGLLLSVGCPAKPDFPPPPETRVDEVVETIHGVEVSDPYRWLEDTDSPEVQTWIKSQNDYAKSIMASIPGGEKTRERLEQLLRHDTYRSPLAAGGKYFFLKREAMAERAVIAMREQEGGEDRILVDPQSLDLPDNARVRLHGASQNARVLVYSVDIPGQENSLIRFFDVQTKKDRPDRMPAARYSSLTLLPDGSGLYYVARVDGRPSIRYHRLGSKPGSDQALSARAIPGMTLGENHVVRIGLSNDARWLVIRVFDGAAGHASVFLWDRKNKRSRAVVERMEGHFSVRVADTRIFIATDWQAPEGRVLVTDVEDPSQEKWEELIPAHAGRVLEDMRLAGGKLYLRYLEDVKSRIVSFSANGEELGEIRFDGIGSVSAVRGRWDSSEAFFTFESFHIPRTIYRLDTDTGLRTVWAQPKMPVDPNQYHVQQVWYRSKDGTEIPMFIVHRKGAHLDGNNHMALAGFGAFGVSMSPGFSASAVTWLDDGGMFAIASLRGGGDFGETWHEAGKGANKQTAVDDMIAAADWLIREGYCTSESLALEGNGAGALVAAAAMVQRPDLVKTVVMGMPLTDMVRYHEFPNTAAWKDEFGSAEDPEQFEYLYRLSPYHHVEADTDYPGAFLIADGQEGAAITPVHAMKMAAMLQARSSSENPVILRYYAPSETKQRGLEQIIEETAAAHLFLRWQLGDLEIGE